MVRKYIYFLLSCLFICQNVFATPLPEINADGAFLIETNTNTVLYSKNGNLTFYPASTTKVLTSLAIANDLSLNLIVTKSQDAVNTVPSDSSQIGLNVGAQYSVYDGLHAVLMSSDNFVCHDLAVMDSGSIEAFAAKMNALAIQVGAKNSHFVNPHGYHDPDHYTTPSDLAKITEAAFGNRVVKQIAGTLNYDFKVSNTGQIIPLKHTSALLDPDSPYYNEHVVASKTGYHTPAKRTLVAQATYGDMNFVGVVMRTDAPLQFEDMNNLFSYASENFSLKTDTDTQLSYLENHTYSNWAKACIDEALNKGWITNTAHNYREPITKREFLTILRNASPNLNVETISANIAYDGDSIYEENLPITRQALAVVIANYLEDLDLLTISTGPSATDISSLPTDTQDAINFCIQTNLIGLRNTSQFLPTDFVTYEEGVCIITKINDLIERYENFTL